MRRRSIVILVLCGLLTAQAAPTSQEDWINEHDDTDEEQFSLDAELQRLGHNTYLTEDGDSRRSEESNDDRVELHFESSIDPPFVHVEVIQMGKIIPEEDDMYACAGLTLHAEPSWIVGYVPLPQNKSVDMMVLYGCLDKPARMDRTWPCKPDFNGTICNGPNSVLHTWTSKCDLGSTDKQQLLMVGGAYLHELVLMIHYKEGIVQDSSAMELKLLSGEYTRTDAHFLSKYYSEQYGHNCGSGASHTFSAYPNMASRYEVPSDYSDISTQNLESNVQDNNIGASFVDIWSSSLSSQVNSPILEQDPAWPAQDLELGQVSGVDTDSSNGDVLVFHRAGRSWKESDFDTNNVFVNAAERGPIQRDVIIELSEYGGNIKRQSGSGRFYMPHGLTVDHNGDLWLTDVALHQVIKLSGRTFETIMVLGEEFVPGGDHQHFCKPTDVAIERNTGHVFVADGYCNRRVVKFSSNGTFLQEITANNEGSGNTSRSSFNIPHSLALIESRHLICVADRENGRIQCFNTHTGDFVIQIKKREFGGRVFAIAYDPTLDVLYAVNGQSRERIPTQGYTIDLATGEILETWSPQQGFEMPHDIAVGPGGDYVYVAEIISHRVSRFLRRQEENNIRTTK